MWNGNTRKSLTTIFAFNHMTNNICKPTSIFIFYFIGITIL